MSVKRLWSSVAGGLCALGVFANSASATTYDQVELHSGSSSGPVWSGTEVLSGTSAGFVLNGSILQITCHYSTGSGTVNSADVGTLTSLVFRTDSSTDRCPGSGGTTWTIQSLVPFSKLLFWVPEVGTAIGVLDDIYMLLHNAGFQCLFAGANNKFSDISEPSAIVGSQTNPISGFPGLFNFGFGGTTLSRVSGNALVCPSTAAFHGTYSYQGLRNGTLFNIWDRKQGARVQN
jgi:hypothetical protein